MTTRVELGNAQQGLDATLSQLAGTPSQIEWAEQIRPRVCAEFDRVSDTLLAVASKQSEQDRLGTQAIIAILREKRVEVLAKGEAGYFIRDWQELADQVRQLIRKDPRYQAIRLAKAERHRRSDRVEASMRTQQIKAGKGDLQHD
ncbi:MAG: hypothetical protein WBW33_18685 [Bryobacteraceae bacterium]